MLDQNIEEKSDRLQILIVGLGPRYIRNMKELEKKKEDPGEKEVEQEELEEGIIEEKPFNEMGEKFSDFF